MPRKKILTSSGIYLIRNVVSGKLYVGSTQDFSKRFYGHHNFLEQNKHPSRHLQLSWNKYGADAFQWIVFELCSVDVLIDREQYWIDTLNTTDRVHGYNLRKVAHTNAGIKLSSETKRLMSEAHKGKPQSREHAQRQCAARKGRKVTAEQRERMSRSRTKTPIDVLHTIKRHIDSGKYKSAYYLTKELGYSQRIVEKIWRGDYGWAFRDYNYTTTPAPKPTTDFQDSKAVQLCLLW